MLRVDPVQKWIQSGLLRRGARPIGWIALRRRAERNEWSVDIEEEQRTRCRTWHDCTIAACLSRGDRGAHRIQKMMNVIGWSLVAGEPLSGTMAGGLDRDGRGALAQLTRPGRIDDLVT
jgi:hypothetical protein